MIHGSACFQVLTRLRFENARHGADLQESLHASTEALPLRHCCGLFVRDSPRRRAVSRQSRADPGSPDHRPRRAVLGVAVRLKMGPRWHTYWINPGDSGAPTEIRWNLPPGFEAGPIQWPYPERIELRTYILLTGGGEDLRRSRKPFLLSVYVGGGSSCKTSQAKPPGQSSIGRQPPNRGGHRDVPFRPVDRMV